eukprot:Mrub_09873.p1 GENE.Mrub_09873~~Mrub_09873.p1  ORF type:complete len:204 (+),score=16.39 Mrub_09873:25-612(+)
MKTEQERKNSANSILSTESTSYSTTTCLYLNENHNLNESLYQEKDQFPNADHNYLNAKNVDLIDVKYESLNLSLNSDDKVIIESRETCASKSKNRKIKRKIRKMKQKNKNYKSDLCTMYMESGECIFGRACVYAHGQHELQSRTFDGRKTEVCLTFKSNGLCPYGYRCNFKHEVEEGLQSYYSILLSLDKVYFNQ